MYYVIFNIMFSSTSPCALVLSDHGWRFCVCEHQVDRKQAKPHVLYCMSKTKRQKKLNFFHNTKQEEEKQRLVESREKTRWLAFYLKGHLMPIAHCLNEQQGVKTA